MSASATILPPAPRAQSIPEARLEGFAVRDDYCGEAQAEGWPCVFCKKLGRRKLAATIMLSEDISLGDFPIGHFFHFIKSFGPPGNSEGHSLDRSFQWYLNTITTIRAERTEDGMIIFHATIDFPRETIVLHAEPVDPKPLRRVLMFTA